jgi:hypothetical protein
MFTAGRSGATSSLIDSGLFMILIGQNEVDGLILASKFHNV